MERRSTKRWICIGIWYAVGIVALFWDSRGLYVVLPAIALDLIFYFVSQKRRPPSPPSGAFTPPILPLPAGGAKASRPQDELGV
jgi:hypothetical protein